MSKYRNYIYRPFFLVLLFSSWLGGCDRDAPLDAGDPCPTSQTGSLKYIGDESCVESTALNCNIENRTYDFSEYFEIKSCPVEFPRCNKTTNSDSYYCSTECSVRRGKACINPADNATCGATEDYNGVDCTAKTQICLKNDENGYHCEIEDQQLDPCSNGKQDPDETAVDCGSSCGDCQKCMSDNDCETGFCDVAKGFVCSKKCKNNNDCLNEGDICREDGRCAPEIFKAVIKIDKDYTPVSLPYNNQSNFDYNYQILWGDEYSLTFDNVKSNDSNITHIYKKKGEYTIQIKGKFYWEVSINETDSPKENLDKLKVNTSNTIIHYITSINSYGNIFFGNYAFASASRLKHIPNHEVPLLKTYDLSYWFAGIDDLDGPVVLDTINVKRMHHMFYNTTYFNQQLSFNTSNVEIMTSMFHEAKAFNQALPQTFNTVNVTDMGGMFANAAAFNQPLPKAFNTANVKNMNWMFAGASAFNKQLPDTFNTENVIYMKEMFANASKFNQPLPEAFDTSNVTDMSGMFNGARAFNQPLPQAFDTSNVTNMNLMFNGASAFNQDVSNLTFKHDTAHINMFTSSGLDNSNYCKVLEKFINDTGNSNPNLGLGTYNDVCQ